MKKAKIISTENQEKAINDLGRRLFIAAGAGSGKTDVVAKRFVEAIARGTAAIDQILTITFTRKAAAEMMERVRDVLREKIAEEKHAGRLENMRQAARNIESAHISTIDSFYSRLLRSQALAAGIDPDFIAADETRSLILREEAFDTCLKDFVSRHGGPAADLVMAYDPKLDGALFGAIDQIYNTLRNRGQLPRLPRPDLDKQTAEARLRLMAALDDFDEAVKSTGAAGVTVDKLKETNWHLLGAVKTTDLAVREQLLLAGQPKGGLKKIKPELDELRAAQAAFLLAVQSQKALPVLQLMDDLLVAYGRYYTRMKDAAGILDFADLSLRTRDLLLRNPGIGRRLASAFKLVMVDEFQDTNPLQHQIFKMITGDNLMMVGDTNQSIYGFRDAEVTLFQAENKRATREDFRIKLLDNFRSQPEILAFVDHIFQGEDMLSPDYLRLVPRAKPDPHVEDFRVEVIMVDESPPGAESKLAAAEGRRVEAQLIAERLKELYGEGKGYSPGDTAMLVAARTDVDLYRDALERNGIKSYLGIGDRYYKRPELGDVINLMKLLLNPLDDGALVGVLRSPYVNAPDDSLYWLRQMAGRDRTNNPRPLWEVMRSERTTNRLAEDEGTRLLRFAEDLNSARDQSSLQPLQDTVRLLISYNDYDCKIAARHNGKQAFANLMKLLDLAADFEDAWGRDLAAFTEFLVYQKKVKMREADAPIEEEGVDAVRIMTMHSAKGLEFPLVVLPKLGARKSRGRSKPVFMVDKDEAGGRIGLVYSDGNGQKLRVFDYEQLEGEKTAREFEEEKRLHYVAMTRAERHLILSGCGSVDKSPELDGKARPLDWIRARLALDRENRPGLDELDVIRDTAGISIGLTVCTEAEEVLQRAARAEAAGDVVRPQCLPAEIAVMPGEAAYVPSVISPTALDTYRSCPRRYFLDNVLNVSDLFEIRGTGKTTIEGGVLSPTDMGTLVHSILETSLPRPGAEAVTRELILERALNLFGAVKGTGAESGRGTSEEGSSTGAEPGAVLVEADINQALMLVGRLEMLPAAAALFSAAAADELQRELSFSTLIGQTILRGQIDALCPLPRSADRPAGTDVSTGMDSFTGTIGAITGASPGMLVVDYKTGSPGEGRTAEEAAQVYRLQMASYALAAFRMRPGPVRVVLAFLGGDEPKQFIQDFSDEDIPRVEAELASVIDDMASGIFPPVDQFDQHQCPWCVGGANGSRLCPQGNQSQLNQP